MVDKKVVADATVGLGVGVGTRFAAGAVAWPALGVSVASDVLSGYLANPERNMDKLMEKEEKRDPHHRRDVIAENNGFREEYKKIHNDRSTTENIARAIPQALLGGMVGDKLHVTNQFKTMMNAGGSMEEFKEMKKEMPALTLPAYVKFRDEAHEEAQRVGKRELGEEAKKAGVHDYDSAIEHVKEKFIKRGTKMQYNSVEKDLWGKGYLLSDAEKSTGQNVADNSQHSPAANPHAPAQDQPPPAHGQPQPQAQPPLASHSQMSGLAANLRNGMQQTGVEASPNSDPAALVAQGGQPAAKGGQPAPTKGNALV
jgi:hypothetical protein